MMAAMGQQDCGQCGYNCEDYADAIFLKSEERLNLCVPGGKETARMLKTLYAEFGAIPAATAVATKPPSAKDMAPRPAPHLASQPALAEVSVKAAASPSRNEPAEIALLSRTRLNKPGSAKETWHVELDLGGSAINYAIGDSLRVFPRNHPALVMRCSRRSARRPTSRLPAARCATS
jgi:sulfite reductase (NADPH) flavoprotein alpha-component